MTALHAGLIAAGLGSRFVARGVVTPKPLVPVAGRPLIEWTVGQLAGAGCARITAIFNEAGADACTAAINSAFPGTGLEVIRKSTASSFESFVEVVSRAGDAAMLVSTVDAVMVPGALRRFVAALASLPEDALVLGVTAHVDDEKPLYVEVGPGGRITALGAGPAAHVTCGVYRVPPGLLVSNGERSPRPAYPALRALLGDLIARGVPAFAVDCGPTIDVDRPEDVAAAERLLAAEPAQVEKVS